jgi:hypothetical protein
MKKELLKPMLMAAAAFAGGTLLTGCASMNHDSAQANNGALSSVAFTTVTSPKELVKWSSDPFLGRNLRSIDTYTFQVPDTGGTAADELTVSNAAAPAETSPAGVGAGPGPYQTGSGSYKVIKYRPGISGKEDARSFGGTASSLRLGA